MKAIIPPARCLAAFVATLIVVWTSLGARAEAAVNIYSEMWSSDDVDASGNATVYGAGEGDTDEPHPFTLTMRMLDPNQNVLAWGQQSGCCWLRIERSITINSSSPQGEYKTVAEADRFGVHIGCVFSSGLLGGGIFTYYLDYVESGTRAHYLRCNPGICSGIWVRLDSISPPSQSYPVYLYVSVTSLNLGVVRFCWGFSAQATGACGPDPMP